MSHNARIEDDLFYASARPLPETWWQALDTNLSKALNGDGGGTWAPSSAIIVNGAGLGVGATWTISGGAKLTTPAASGARIEHDDNDYIELLAGHTGASRTLVTPCARIIDASGVDAMFAVNNPILGAAISASGIVPANTTGAPPGRILLPLRVHDGATMTQVVFWFVIAVHAGVPTSLPQFRVYKVDVSGNVTPLRSSSTLANGFEPFSPTPASGAAWHNSGTAQSFTYTLDASVVIDISQYSYVAEIADESGTNTVLGNVYTSAVGTFSSIPDLRPQ